MTHRGPYFKHISEPYKSMGSSLTYEGKKYKGPSVALKKMDELKGR